MVIACTPMHANVYEIRFRQTVAARIPIQFHRFDIQAVAAFHGMDQRQIQEDGCHKKK